MYTVDPHLSDPDGTEPRPDNSMESVGSSV